MKEKKEEICYKCSGRGLVRANYTNNEGKYVLHKEVCGHCLGTGRAHNNDFDC